MYALGVVMSCVMKQGSFLWEEKCVVMYWINVLMKCGVLSMLRKVAIQNWIKFMSILCPGCKPSSSLRTTVMSSFWSKFLSGYKPSSWIWSDDMILYSEIKTVSCFCINLQNWIILMLKIHKLCQNVQLHYMDHDNLNAVTKSSITSL
jgi:hypothetical protein